MFWKTKSKRLFLDFASTTPITPEVMEAMREAERELWANPSALYEEAILSKKKLAEAKQTIAGILTCQEKDIIFTSGGTESNNLALLGVFEHYNTKIKTPTSDVGKVKNSPRGTLGEKGFVPHIITTAIEHSSILEVCKEIERRGGEVTYLPVSEEGIVSAKDVRGALKENTVLVSVMYANNEIGTIQPIKEIGRVIKDFRNTRTSSLEPRTYPLFHTDACQAVLYEELHTQKLGVDMMTLDGIKIYGPRGFGMLYAKSHVELSPILFGGGQEGGKRSGTENVVGAVGFACALEFAQNMRTGESGRLAAIRDYGIEEISKAFPRSSLNGSWENRLPNNINICFPGIDAEFAVISLDVAGISASYSSSCRTLAEDSSSYVISALRKSRPKDIKPEAVISLDGAAMNISDCASSSLRFTLGRESTKSDIDALITVLKRIVLS